MLQVLEKTSEGVFVPLTVGGGIRGFTDSDGNEYSPIQVAAQYFRYDSHLDYLLPIIGTVALLRVLHYLGIEILHSQEAYPCDGFANWLAVPYLFCITFIVRQIYCVLHLLCIRFFCVLNLLCSRFIMQQIYCVLDCKKLHINYVHMFCLLL